MKRSLVISLAGFAFEALAGVDGATAEHVPARLGHGLRYYLAEGSSNRSGWRHPDFLSPRSDGGRVRLELQLDASVWEDFERTADSQGASVEQMLDHVALYFASEVDSGRVTQRILDDLGHEGRAAPN